MKLKGIFIIPMIGLGWFDETMNLFGEQILYRHIVLGFLKIEMYKRL